MQSNAVFDWSRESNPAPFLVMSRLASYPTRIVWSDIRELFEQQEVLDICELASSRQFFSKLTDEIRDTLKDSAIMENVAARYIDLFDRGVSENSLYETEYGVRRAQLKTTELADISGFYKAFGLKLSDAPETREMLDHLAVEAEFYAVLIAKQLALFTDKNAEGEDIVFDARKKFLQDHLGRFPSAIAKRPAVIADPFYSLVFLWCAEVLENECDRLGVGVVPVDYSYGSELEEEITCGGDDQLITSIGGKQIS